MSIFVYVITDIIHIIKIMLLCDLFFMFKKREMKNKHIAYIVLMSAMVGLSVGIYLWNNDFVEMIIYCISISLILCAIYSEKINRILICSLWVVSILSMLDIMFVILLDEISYAIGYSNDDISRVVASIISFVFILVVGKIFNNKYRDGIKTIGITKLVLFTILALIDTFVVMSIATITVKIEEGDHRIFYSIAFSCAILGIFLQLVAVIILFVQRNVYKEKKQVTEKYLNEQKNYYEYLENREKETKKFRHDIRNHMQLISMLAKERRYEEFDRYIEKIDMKLETFGNVVTVQNGIVDAIINQYYSKAIQNNIKMDVIGRFPEECDIDAYDLCTIFSNVLSNAYEATLKAVNKTISVECRYTDKNIIVIVKNSFDDVGQFKNNRIKSNKSDMDYHGFGLVNIRESIEKYNGVMDIETKNSEFVLKILLNCTEKRKYENSNYR